MTGRGGVHPGRRACGAVERTPSQRCSFGLATNGPYKCRRCCATALRSGAAGATAGWNRTSTGTSGTRCPGSGTCQLRSSAVRCPDLRRRAQHPNHAAPWHSCRTLRPCHILSTRGQRRRLSRHRCGCGCRRPFNRQPHHEPPRFDETHRRPSQSPGAGRLGQHSPGIRGVTAIPSAPVWSQQCHGAKGSGTALDRLVSGFPGLAVTQQGSLHSAGARPGAPRWHSSPARHPRNHS